MSEADIYDTIQHDLHESPLSLSPESVIASSVAQSYSTAPSYIQDDLPALSSLASDLKRYKVIRGISSGGSATKPPRVVTLANHHYAPVSLELVGATLHDLCLPQWSDEEKQDRRRIIRVERFQIGSRIVAQFSILGSAKENPKTMPAAPGVDVVEVSCLDCYTSANEDEDEYSDSADYGYKTESELKRAFYITSVEVIKVVELLIGTEVQDAVERRRERGRIRSNLVPFWSKKPISSRMSNQEIRNSPLGSDSLDFRVELATRIMSYEVRKPRGFDKEVRILKWDKLVPALKRALQSYYVEVPDDLEEAF
ncbi:CYFA0S02e09604g1_1 [Cyberlindnera fabianii]|uniref:CYFA0S02e09604g1_1 n=1 Tax=Cyberlindnera fabianii TaxID=36022 RepID=A0A061APC6_CYBFA|nr:CYFA0S02e09604g1_1 [Cyberlindnera fabianii]